MDEARTEQPTARRLERAGLRGLRSPDLIAALALCAFLGALFAWGSRMQSALFELLHAGLGGAGSPAAGLAELLGPLRELAWLSSGLLCSVLVAAGLSAVAQGGLVLAPAARGGRGRTPWGERWRELFAPERLLDGAITLLKASVLLAVAGFVLVPALRGLLGLAAGGAGRAYGLLLGLFGELLLRFAAVAVLLGAADLVYRRVRQRARLRMTRRELVLEHREIEGAPELRAARERLRREARAQFELAGLERAQWLLIDGAGRALGLGLAPEDPAPRVVAKGQGELAERLRQRAEQEGLSVRLDPALVAALFPLELTELVPRARYEALVDLFHEAGVAAQKPPS